MLKTFDDVKIFEDTEYSFEKIAARKRICGVAMLSVQNSFCTLSNFAPCETEFSAELLSNEDKSKIISHLNAFSKKLLICEIGAKLCVFLPTLYPSSSLCVVLVFDGGQFTVSELLRLIACDECPDIFVMSDSITSKAARMSDALLSRGEIFFEFCRELSDVLLDLGSPFEYGKDDCTALVLKLLKLSAFIGCPIDSLDFDENVKLSSLFDLPLLLSFVITFMLVALNDAPSRSIGISLFELSGELCVKLTLPYKNESLSLPVVEWETIAADKNMLFEVDVQNDHTFVSFQPIRRDWSYLGLKQNTEFI